MSHDPFSRLPQGPDERRQLIQALLEKSELRETNYLEVKSEFHLTNKDDQSKVAKFILGAANRTPEEADHYLEGHALLVAGIDKNSIIGISGQEFRDLSTYVSDIIGEEGPRWWREVETIEGKDVLFIFVEPPTGEIYPAMKEASKIRDGDLTIRRDQETSRMTGREVRTRIRRIKDRIQNSFALKIEVLSPINVDLTSERAAKEMIRQHAYLLKDSAPESERANNSQYSAGLLPERNQNDESPPQYRKRVEEWVKEINENLDPLRDALISENSIPLKLRLTVESQRYLDGVQMILELPPEASAFFKQDFQEPEKILNELSPEFWRSPFDLNISYAPNISELVSTAMPSLGSGAIINGDDNKQLVLPLGGLHPHTPTEVEIYDVFLLWDADPSELPLITWRVTTENIPGVQTGETQVETSPVRIILS